MGLDMYLRARKTWAIDSQEAKELATMAGTTVLDLLDMSARDPMEHETELYLSRWSFEEGTPGYRRVTDIYEAAGLLPLTTEHSGGGSMGVEDVDGVPTFFVACTCIYWRKANAVHSWFVKHCQDGVDECQLAPVAAEQLAKLRSDCLAVLDDTLKADLLLPPQAGFFFGSTDVDEYYLADLRETVTEIERVIRLAIEIGDITFAYQSSW